MKFTTEDMNDIKWISNPDDYAAGDTIRKIMDAGKWEEFLKLHQDEETGEVDCDALYDYLRHESDEALADVGLHDAEATATVAEVVAKWEEENPHKPVQRNERGEAEVSIYGNDLYLTTLEDGEEDEVCLDADEVLELTRDKHHGNANAGEWDCEDTDSAEFEMWHERH